MRALRFGVPVISRQSWAGGFNYLANMFRALDKHQKGRVAPVLLAGETCDAGDIGLLAAIPGVEVVRSPAFNADTNGLRTALLTGRDPEVEAVFSQARLDVVFENARYFGWRPSVPVIPWMPDFQHRHLPAYFQKGAWWKREIGFQIQSATRRVIIVSSQDARADLERFYPLARGRGHVVRFSTEMPTESAQADASSCPERYGLPPCFFYLPNQFWRHKNHMIVIRALEVLKKEGVDVVVAATGSNRDHRDPTYFPEIQKSIEAAGLQSCFRYLGMIPHVDVHGLMRTCAALLNPSMFEGWNTSVEDGLAFGTPLILSDLGVHREQACDNALYFAVDDHQALAGHMKAVMANWTPGPPRPLRKESVARVKRFAEDLVKALEQAASARAA